MLRQNTTTPVYGYPAGTSLCLGYDKKKSGFERICDSFCLDEQRTPAQSFICGRLDMCQSHVTATPCDGSTPPNTEGRGACMGSAAALHMHWGIGLVNDCIRDTAVFLSKMRVDVF